MEGAYLTKPQGVKKLKVPCAKCGAMVTWVSTKSTQYKGYCWTCLVTAKKQAYTDVVGPASPFVAPPTPPGGYVKMQTPAVKPGTPKTQKAKGIKVLQAGGHLPQAYAKIALTEAEAITAAQATGLPCFVRPCPVTPRHGFVDSRVVKSVDEVRQVWAEARAADPEAELIVMPFIKATHNMVWRPGLLSVGPGHDGATAGHDSVSIFLQPGYAKSWQGMATQAGCDLAKSDPFIEAVANDTTAQLLTQIRAGVKGAPTEPDWNPHDGMTVGEIVTIDPAHKSDPGAMLAWETTAKTLTPGLHVVWNPGGNLGDHWSVHAQLAGVSVITSFKPALGQVLAKMGIDLVPLEPQAIIFGYLGGLVRPSLALPVQRKRAACAAVLGTHHGIRMGGDAGVFIGASVALMLRLGISAIWGEARHKSNPGKLSRDQVYLSVLDNFVKGRDGLQGRGDLFFTKSWSSGYGGPAWGACSQATADLDRVMRELIQDPTEDRAKQVLATLTNVVNLAHNGGWWLDKFIETEWFDLAADLDPRVAIMAGPAWYDAMTAGMQDRMQILSYLEKCQPVDFTKHGVDFKAKLAKPNKMGETAEGLGMTPPVVHIPDPTTGKQFTLPAVQAGGVLTVPGPALSVQGKPQDGKQVHIQVKVHEAGAYFAGTVVYPAGIPMAIMAAMAAAPQAPSMAGTATGYAQFTLVPASGGYTVQVGGLSVIQLSCEGGL